MTLGRTYFLSKRITKISRTVALEYQVMQFHSSSYLAKRKPFRRKVFQVYLPQDNGSKDQTESHTSSPVNIVGEPTSDTFANLNRTRQNDTQETYQISQGDTFSSSHRPKQVYSKAPSDKRFGNAMLLAKNRKLRDSSNRVVLEGFLLVRDALLAGARCHILFFSMISYLDGLPINKNETELVKISYKEFEHWSDLATPQGVIGIFSKPSYQTVSQDESDPCLPLTLVCDNVRDPGNLGTILRAAAAANCEQILVTKGCVDIWDPKVLRAGAGAHFHTPINSRVTWSDVQNHINDDVALHIADSNKQPNKTTSEGGSLLQMAHSELDWSSQSALVIGGETEGISREATELCGRTHGVRVYIPMSRKIDSLNAAMSTTVLLFEAKRQWMLYQRKLRTS